MGNCVITQTKSDQADLIQSKPIQLFVCALNHWMSVGIKCVRTQNQIKPCGNQPLPDTTCIEALLDNRITEDEYHMRLITTVICFYLQPEKTLSQ